MNRLVLKLGPKERILINGAVIENGDRRARITILSPKANILRLRDAIHPNQTNTPVRRACYLAQILMSGDVDPSSTRLRLQGQIELLADILKDHNAQIALNRASASIMENNAYLCLKFLRELLPLEEKLLSGNAR